MIFKELFISILALLADYRIWHDETAGKSAVCLCVRTFRKVKCVNLNCRSEFIPQCRAELFCSLDCLHACRFHPYLQLLIRYEGCFAKLRKNINGKAHKLSDKGRKSKERENEKRRESRAVDKLRSAAGPEEKAPRLEKILHTLYGIPVAVDTPEGVRDCANPACHRRLPVDVVNGLAKRYCDSRCREAARVIRQRLNNACRTVRCPVVLFLLTVFEYVVF